MAKEVVRPYPSKRMVNIKPKVIKRRYEKNLDQRVALIQGKEKEIKEIDEKDQDDLEIASSENKEPVVRERARERIRGRTEQRNALIREKEELEEGMPLRGRKKIYSKSTALLSQQSLLLLVSRLALSLVLLLTL